MRCTDARMVTPEHNKIVINILQGEPSVFDTETARAGAEEPVGRRTSRQIAGTDYQHAETCQVC